MKLKHLSLLSILVLFLLSACKNDIEINAPWKEVPVVYGFLDAGQTTQSIRIEKLYQNSIDQSTHEGAQISDSLYFDSLVVKVIADGGAPEFLFHRVDYPKDSGFFTSQGHRIYQNTNFKPSINRNYVLSIYHPASGKTYTSTTGIVGAADFAGGGSNFMSINRDGNGVLFGAIRISYVTGANTGVYNSFIRMNYKQFPATDSSRSESKFVDYPIDQNWKVTSPTRSLVLSTESDNSVIRMMDVFKDGAKIPQGYNARITSFQFISIGGTSAINDLISLSVPSAGLIPKETNYSNITGGLGVFASTSTVYYSPQVSQTTYRYFAQYFGAQFIYP